MKMVWNEQLLKHYICGSLGVDVALSVALYFSGSRMATFITDLRVDLPCEAHISTTTGQIKIAAPFWCPPAMEINGVREEFPLPFGVKHPLYFTNSQGLAFEAAEVRRCLKVEYLMSSYQLIILPIAGTD